MSATPVDSTLRLLHKLQLVRPDQLAFLERERNRWSSVDILFNEIRTRNWLTGHQIEALTRGDPAALVFGQYVLVERLGQGGMGTVYKAWHRRLERFEALKVIRSDRLGDRDMVARFQREIKAAARLSHPNVITLHGADEVGDVLYLAMEYVEGMDLSRMLKEQGPLPTALAVDLLAQAAAGLQHVFENGLVHRDIKPGNLLRSKDGRLKLLDLGLSRARSMLGPAKTELTTTDVLVGTPDYMAPEQWSNARTADIRADLYSLGCTFYRLLTGDQPFPGPDLFQKLEKHRSAAPPPLSTRRPDCPPILAEVIAKLMAKTPAERYQTPAEVVRALTPLGAIAPPTAGSSATSAYSAKDVALASPGEAATVSFAKGDFSRARLWGVLGAGAATTVLLILIVYLLVRGDGAPAAKSSDPPIALPPDGKGKGVVSTIVTSKLMWVVDDNNSYEPAEASKLKSMLKLRDASFSKLGLMVTTGYQRIVQWEIGDSPLKPAQRYSDAKNSGIPKATWTTDGSTHIVASPPGDAPNPKVPVQIIVCKPEHIGRAEGLSAFHLPDVKTVEVRATSKEEKVVLLGLFGTSAGRQLMHVPLEERPAGKDRHTVTPTLFVHDKGSQFSTFALDPHGNMLAAATPDGQLLLFDLGSPKPSGVFPGVHLGIQRLAASAKCETVAGLTADGELRHWDGNLKRLACTYSGAAPNPADLIFSPDGNYLLAASRETNTVHIWSVGTDKELHSIRLPARPINLSCHPYRPYLAVATEDGLVYIYVVDRLKRR